MNQTLLLPAIFTALCLLWRCGTIEKSGLSNCVVIEKKADCTGKWLKHQKEVFFGCLKTPECVQKDAEIDMGDCPKKEKVRWAECRLKGPDCGEAGLLRLYRPQQLSLEMIPGGCIHAPCMNKLSLHSKSKISHLKVSLKARSFMDIK